MKKSFACFCVVGLALFGLSVTGASASDHRGVTRVAVPARLSSTCRRELSAFTQSATAGTYTSLAKTIAFPSPPTLDNPSTPGKTTLAQHVAIPYVVYGTTAKATTRGKVTIYIYGAPRGSVKTTPVGTGTSPIVVSPTSGSSISLTYSGTYLNRPITVVATSELAKYNVCTHTRSWAIGTTTLALANHPSALGSVSYTSPTACYGGTSGTACAAQNVGSTGLGISAAVGYGSEIPGRAPASVRSYSSFTIDTGSIGTALPRADIGPDAIGPGALALKYYDSSGNEFIGYVYLAPVTFKMGGAQAVTDPIEVLGVMSSACHPQKPCTKAPGFADFHYLGVGFDRSTGSAADPFLSPSDNALLAIEAPAGSTMTQGYVLSGSSVTAGITSPDSAGASLVQLSANSTYPGDWQGTSACVSFATATIASPTPVCGNMLMDVGIPEMFVTFVSTSAEPQGLANGLGADATISVTSPNASSPALTDSFSSGPAGGGSPPAVAMAPSKVEVSVSPTLGATVFINTGRHVLYRNQYVFNAQAGEVGFIPLVTPLR